MADLEFRQALRHWYSEKSDQARERLIFVGLRQGMSFWDILKYALGFSDEVPLHEAVRDAIRRGGNNAIREVLDVVADKLAPMHTNALSHAMRRIGQDAYGNSDYVTGTTYNIGFVDWENRGESYLLEDGENGRIFRGENTLVQVHDQAIIDEILNQATQDFLIYASRRYLAEEEAGGDDTLYRILIMSINYAGGVIDEPEYHDYDGVSIPFWEVGRNSSHEFYYGYLESTGQLYKMSSCYDYNEEGESFLDINIYPVDGFGGYAGHL